MSRRVAIVTGGLTGIGLACAQALIKAGHKVAVGSRRGADDPVAKNARALLGGGILLDALDVRDQGAVARFVANVTDQLGTPTILVNAHGIYDVGFLPDHADDTWFDQLDINLHGVFRMIRTCYPAMQAANHGRIVNISSTAGHVGAAGYAAYCASKAGVIGLSKAVAVEGAPHNITCVSISPTWIDTPMMDQSIARRASSGEGDAATLKEALKSSNPQGRLVQSEEVAALVAFCCGDQAPALTNEDIQINAGALW